MTRRSWLVLGASLGAVAALLGFSLRGRAVPAAALVRGTAVEAVYASGTVEPVLRAEVRARAGGPLLELHVREGDVVKAGQLLARIDAPVLSFDMARGRADSNAARLRKESAPQLVALRAQEQGLAAQVEQARSDVARVTDLVKTGVQPPLELERARTQLSSLTAQLDSNRAQQGDVSLLLDAEASRSAAGAASLTARAGDAEVRAPIDGTVLVLRVERGETVTLNQPLLRVGDLTRLRVEALVDEADVGRLRVGTEAALRLPAFDDRLVKGRITHLAPQADRERKTFEVDLSLDDAPAGLRPGMTAEINLISRRLENVLLAPAEALARGGSALLVARGGRAVRVPVTAGIRDLTRVEVSGDLREGEWVVLEPVPEGTRVRPFLTAGAASGAR